MKYTKFLALIVFINQTTTLASEVEKSSWKILTTSYGQEKQQTPVDSTLTLYQTNKTQNTIPLPLAAHFTCYFFAGQDKEGIDNLWFKKDNSCFIKDLLLSNLFTQALKQFYSYLHEPSQLIKITLTLEEKKLIEYKELLRIFYFDCLYYQTIRKNPHEAQEISQSIKKTKETLRRIELKEIEYQDNENCSYSPHPNPFLIVLLREYLTKRDPYQEQTTPFITELKRYGLFSDLDRIISSGTTQYEHNQNLFALDSDEEAPF